ncbi:hypothetical protein [Flagellimonas lutimaris]|uniref:hypothetical protein n=1 Tax=Flagellimonas lutimaris TaxID=475082 RepID=UPI0039C034DE
MILDKIDYAFDDEVVSKFCYNSSEKYIEVQFEGCYIDGNYVESPYSLIIENWYIAKSKLYGESEYSSLENYLGIFSMILSLEKSHDKLELSVNTVDDKYIELLFEQSKVRVEKSI